MGHCLIDSIWFLGLWWRVATIGRHPGPSGSKWATSWCYLIRKVLWTSSRTLITTAIVFAPPRRGIARKNIKKVSPGFFVAGFSWSRRWPFRRGCAASRRSSRCARTWTEACRGRGRSLSSTASRCPEAPTTPTSPLSSPKLSSVPSTVARCSSATPATRSFRRCATCDAMWRVQEEVQSRWQLLAADQG